MPATRHAPCTIDADRSELWDLLDQARNGDKAAFDRFYTATFPTVHRKVMRRVLGDRDLADEITADVYLTAWRTLPGVRRRDGISPLAWLSTIARCRVIDHQRYRNRRPAVPAGGADDIAEVVALRVRSAEHHGVARAEAREVWQYAEQLSPDQHRVLRARFWFGLSVPDTAAALGKPITAVKALQYRALVNLRAQLRGSRLDPAVAA